MILRDWLVHSLSKYVLNAYYVSGLVLGVEYSKVWIKHTNNTFPWGTYILSSQMHADRAREIHLSLQNIVPWVLPVTFTLPRLYPTQQICPCQIRAFWNYGSLEPSPIAPVEFICGHHPISPTSSLPETLSVQLKIHLLQDVFFGYTGLGTLPSCPHSALCYIYLLIPPAKLWNSFKANIHSLCLSVYVRGNRSLPHWCWLGQSDNSRCEASRGLLVLAWLSLHSCAPKIH